MKTEDRRGLDHLMEQNETELDFLAAYGGVDDGQRSDGEAIVSALERFLKAGGVACTHKKGVLKFAFGSAQATATGCVLKVKGQHLPLVHSDMHGSGFQDSTLNADRSEACVCLTQWGINQRRFVERLVEYQRPK